MNIFFAIYQRHESNYDVKRPKVNRTCWLLWKCSEISVKLRDLSNKALQKGQNDKRMETIRVCVLCPPPPPPLLQAAFQAVHRWPAGRRSHRDALPSDTGSSWASSESRIVTLQRPWWRADDGSSKKKRSPPFINPGRPVPPPAPPPPPHSAGLQQSDRVSGEGGGGEGGVRLRV